MYSVILPIVQILDLQITTLSEGWFVSFTGRKKFNDIDKAENRRTVFFVSEQTKLYKR